MKTLVIAISIILGMGTVTTRLSAEEETYLQLKPGKCVALRKGQVCYQRIKVSFGTRLRGDFCIHVGDKKQPLKCWNNSSQGSFSYDFNAPESTEFSLRETSGKQLTSTPFTVAWVYSNRSRSRGSWRLF